MKRIIFALMVLGLAVGRVGLVQAAPILDLYNTGVNGAGVALPDGTIGDPHYNLVSVPISVPISTTDIRVRTEAGGWPIPPYLLDSASSAWIGPNNDPAIDGPVGHYDYQTTFSLAAVGVSTAAISGGWSTDNNGMFIFLNGVNTGNPGTAFDQFSKGYVPFSITTGFVSGQNTLDFWVNNGSNDGTVDGSSGNLDWNPTALRVEMTGTAPVPEPETYAMLLVGLGLIGFTARRKKDIEV